MLYPHQTLGLASSLWKNHTWKSGAGSVWISKFGSIRFGFQSQLPGFVFFRFWFLHITTMKFLRAHAAGKTSKGSEAVEAFTPQLHAFTISSLALQLKCIADAGALLK